MPKVFEKRLEKYTSFRFAIDELEAFDYEEYKKNGFKVNKLGDYDLTLDFDKKPE